jgi:hypothetical protein
MVSPFHARDEQNVLLDYSNFDFAGDNSNRRSTTGFS